MLKITLHGGDISNVRKMNGEIASPLSEQNDYNEANKDIQSARHTNLNSQ